MVHVATTASTVATCAALGRVHTHTHSANSSGGLYSHRARSAGRTPVCAECGHIAQEGLPKELH